MSKHTPGPWYYGYGSIWTTPNGPDDGGISIGGADRSDGRTMPTERDANARLMSAAPELLAALEAALAAMQRAYTAGAFADAATMHLCGAAIARAKGGQS